MQSFIQERILFQSVRLHVQISIEVAARSRML